jgi:hypothetical protein
LKLRAAKLGCSVSVEEITATAPNPAYMECDAENCTDHMGLTYFHQSHGMHDLRILSDYRFFSLITRFPGGWQNSLASVRILATQEDAIYSKRRCTGA